LNTAGTQNTFIGTESGEGNKDGNYGTFLGFRSGEKNNADHNTFIGRVSGAFTTSGKLNTFLGSASGYRNTAGFENTFLGVSAGFDNRGGDYNTSVGRSAGRLNRWGNSNTYLGYEAGYRSNGHGNVFIGNKAGREVNGVSNKLFIHNNESDSPLIYGDFEDATRQVTINGDLNIPNGNLNFGGPLNVAKTFVLASDLKVQENVTSIDEALHTLNQINGITYSEKTVNGKKADAKQVGFVANDVEKVLPDLVTKDEKGNSYINYNGFTPIIVEALKEQEAVINSQEFLIEKQESEIKLQRDQIADLESRMNSLESLINNSKAENQTNVIEKIGEDIVLKQNIPNPASQVTTIDYDIPQTLKAVSLNVYDINGKTLLSQPVTGKNSFEFDLSTLAGGTYIYTLNSNSKVIAKQKMVVKK